jgi:hypothetical protein
MGLFYLKVYLSYQLRFIMVVIMAVVAINNDNSTGSGTIGNNGSDGRSK